MKENKLISNTHFPKWLLDFYLQTINEFGFVNKSEVIQYLIECLWNKQNGVSNSQPVENILSYVKRKRCTFFSHAERSWLVILLTPEAFKKIDQIRGFPSRASKIQALIEAFLSCKISDKRLLQKEIHLKRRCLPFTRRRLDTYVQDDAYKQLKRMAARLEKGVNGLIHFVIDIVIKQEDTEFEFCDMPKEVKQTLKEVLLLEGSTLSRFKRQEQICIYVNDENVRQAISNIIFKYEIPGANEFLRRIIIFLLDSSRLILSGSDECPDSITSSLLSQYESDRYLSLSNKDFYYSKFNI
ncbi:hypothetical protein [Parabacteroides sp. PF5-9]|uniref:hypothetical protein n=1 Tax=Parabacteroides sp. PF5-9 TaxID=1742404 RepID=UPI0024745B9B|nr:hypothetical protein [Parabacteroides sp. PF5-9]MDH6357222.1 hypothetical protein [Parabacteroides sp. PF5-9]